MHTRKFPQQRWQRQRDPGEARLGIFFLRLQLVEAVLAEEWLGVEHHQRHAVVAAVALGLMLWAIIWQSNVIVYQRDIIRWMWNARVGS